MTFATCKSYARLIVEPAYVRLLFPIAKPGMCRHQQSEARE